MSALLYLAVVAATKSSWLDVLYRLEVLCRFLPYKCKNKERKKQKATDFFQQQPMYGLFMLIHTTPFKYLFVMNPKIVSTQLTAFSNTINKKNSKL